MCIWRYSGYLSYSSISIALLLQVHVCAFFIKRCQNVLHKYIGTDYKSYNPMKSPDWTGIWFAAKIVSVLSASWSPAESKLQIEWKKYHHYTLIIIITRVVPLLCHSYFIKNHTFIDLFKLFNRFAQKYIRTIWKKLAKNWEELLM